MLLYCLLHQYLGRGTRSIITSWVRTAGSGHRHSATTIHSFPHFNNPATTTPIKTPAKPTKHVLKQLNQTRSACSSSRLQILQQAMHEQVALVSKSQLQHYPMFPSSVAILPSNRHNNHNWLPSLSASDSHLFPGLQSPPQSG